MQSFEHDADGRMVREVLASKSKTYDDKGRIATAAQDGRVHRTFEYGAACPASLRIVRAPTAPQRAGLDVCIRSPGYGYGNCFYAQR